MWTNTCCSHPLDNYKGESEGVKGVLCAARRKLVHELHIGDDFLIPDKDFILVTRILYKAAFDEVWGEHELDYILFVKEQSITQVTPDPGEVENVKLVTPKELKELVENPNSKITPWFRLIYDKYLFKWWDSFLKGELKSDYHTILNLYNDKFL